MEILLIGNQPKRAGGLAVQIRLLKEKLEEEGIRVSLVNTKQSLLKRIFYLPLLLAFKGFRKNVFHIHGCSYAGFFPILLGVIIGKLLRKKIIVTYHGGDAKAYFDRHGKFAAFFLKKATKVIVLSEFLKSVFKKYGIRTEVIPNILNISSHHFVERNTFFPNLITTRALARIYDIATAIDALAIVQKRYPHATLYIVGTGPEESTLKRIVTDRGIKNVFFTGYVANKEIYYYLNKADIWCNPTTKDNMPMSMLEAINAGLVVVSTNVGGIPYMVEHEKSAWLVNKGDSIGMAKGIFKIIDDPQLAQGFIKNARATLCNYDWTQIKGRLFAIYEN
jgi:L-malate glycosyltransferase